MNVLAGEFGVSVIPVRDALRTLAAEGLVELQPHRGAIVSRISREDLAEIFMARVPLEVLVARRAILHVTPADIRRLGSLERQMERASEATQWLAINRSFHMHLYTMSGFPRIVRLIEGLWDLMQPYLLAARTDGEGRRDAEREHRQILDAIGRGDAETLATTLENHLRQTSVKVIPMHDIREAADEAAAATVAR